MCDSWSNVDKTVAHRQSQMGLEMLKVSDHNYIKEYCLYFTWLFSESKVSSNLLHLGHLFTYWFSIRQMMSTVSLLAVAAALLCLTG